jgi:ribosome-binding protein aMBF1 (putative translation factor)
MIRIGKDVPVKTKTCPVCGMEIKDRGITVNADGHKVTVCCEDCAKKAAENPAEYVEVAR